MSPIPCRPFDSLAAVGRGLAAVALLALASHGVSAERAAAVTPPSQPTTGPGGSDYRFTTVRETIVGSNGDEYRIYEPADAPLGEALPVIGFIHGWSAIDPAPYAGWIQHLVKKGNIVIYPRYQRSVLTPTAGMTAASIDALERALATLDGYQHVTGDRRRFALVGHSLGGEIAANIAATAQAVGLPPVCALMAAHPGGKTDGSPTSITGDYSTIPARTLLLAVVGDSDNLAGRTAATVIFNGATRVPAENKDFIVVHSDAHGNPSLVSNHMAPLADDSHPADALDFYGYWKLFDALSSAAFTGRYRSVALGNTNEQRFMGTWSDGVPVTPLDVTDTP